VHSTARIVEDDDSDEVFQLKSRIADLERLLGLHWNPPRVLGLTKKEACVFGLIVKRPGLCTYPVLYDALYSMRDDPPGDDLVRVYCCKVRAKLRPHGIEIGTMWGQGYFITPENMARINALYEPGEHTTENDQ
jgi:two-component system cell cycle response regulator CtrA